MIDQYINQIINADCLDILRQLPDKSIDCCITDPPYSTTSCKWDRVIPFEPMWKELKRIVKDNGAICLFGSEPFSTTLRMSNLEMFKYDWIWQKTKAGNFAGCRKIPMKLHEIISVFYQKMPCYNLWTLQKMPKPIKSSRKNKGAKLGHCNCKPVEYYQTETGFHKSILCFSNKSGKGYSFHPTQKPVELIEYLIKTYTQENEIVLDFCSGSGTTAVACHNLHRRFICIEKDPDYWKASVERLEKIQQQLTLF